MFARVAVVYYSATGNKLAQAVEEGAREAGAQDLREGGHARRVRS